MKEGFSNVIGKKLKEMGKTQSWLARKAGISRAEVSALVHQKIPAPTIQVAWKISKVMRCPLEKLFPELEASFPKDK
jgi:transcriptional regulator with XRE-family HTH domain